MTEKRKKINIKSWNHYVKNWNWEIENMKSSGSKKEKMGENE